MATINVTANTALDTDLNLSGGVTISGADSTYTLNATVYYKNNGATFIGVPQTYSGSGELTYNFANGTVMTVDMTNSTWSFQRLTNELGSTDNEYDITFTLKGSSTVSDTVTVKPIVNVVINEFTANTLDDLDATITGTLDVSITDVTSQKIRIDFQVDNVDMAGTEQNITSASDSFTFNYSDGSKMVANLGTKTWVYTRKVSSVGDGVSNTYSINIGIGNAKNLISLNSFIGDAPLINSFSINPPSFDTDEKISGTLLGDNIVNETAQINVTHNNITMNGTTKTLTENSQVTWTYTDGSSLTVDTSTWDWEYNRVQSDCEDLRTDSYAFYISITSRYGNDTATVSVETTIPTATIIGFSADGVTDTEPTIEGVLKYTLPTVANSPTMRVNVVANGIEYIGIPIDLTNVTEFDFTYNDGSKFLVNATEGTFVYQRATDDTKIPASDSYTFECTIIVNGQITTQSLTVNTYSSIRNYDYQPAYPVRFYAGSPEAENTAWAKYIEEIKRIYRLYNENMNYYESITKGVFKRIDDLEKLVNEISSGLAANLIGIILPYVGDIDNIPSGWHLCDGTNGTPNLTARFLEGTTASPKTNKEAGLPNIVGSISTPTHSYNQFGYLTSPSGAFYGAASKCQTVSSGNQGPWSSPYSSCYGTMGFDAARCNSVYGKSSTVQPRSYTVYYIMRVADAE